MYIFIAVVAASAYALQGTLMASFYRKMDPLSAIAYRGIALGFVMLPLLAFVPFDEFLRTSSFYGHFFLCAILAAIANWFVAKSYRSLPIGIVWALSESFRTITAVGFAILLLNEVLSGYQLAFIASLLVCVVILCLSKKEETTEAVSMKSTLTAITFTLLFGVFIGWSMTLIGSVARECNPLVLAFEWEFTIGLVACLFAFSRGITNSTSLSKISGSDFGKIMLYSSPTVLGTYAFAVATQMGSIAIVSAVLSVSTVAAAIAAYCFYKEKLTPKQYSLIAICCVIIAGLNLCESII